MRRQESGFTLIELMIVIAILAILKAIAIPAYQDYAIRSKVSEGLNVAASAKIAVIETFHSRGSVSDQAATGYASPNNGLCRQCCDRGRRFGRDRHRITRNTGATTDVDLRLTPSLVLGASTTSVCSTVAGGGQARSGRVQKLGLSSSIADNNCHIEHREQER